MTLKETIQKETNSALKAKEELKLQTLRQLLAAFQIKEKDKRFTFSKENFVEEELLKKSELSDQEIQDIISFEAKKRREAIEGFEKGGRQEMADKEKQELEILKEYLPEQMGEQEIRTIVKEVIKSTGSKSIQDIGKIMAELMPKVKGKADGSLVNKIVKESF